MDTKLCTRCKETKPVSEFYVLKAGSCGRVNDGRFPECKACNIARALAWNAANPEKVTANKARAHRNRKLREKYGITPAEYDEMLAEQSGRCAICGSTDPG